MATGFVAGKGRALIAKPKPVAPKPVAPARPAAPGPQGRPVDPIYDAQTGSANRNLGATLAQLQYQRGMLGQTYGIGITPQGQVFDDPSNPYSRAAAMKLAHDRSVQGTTTSMAARGQLYAGATQTAQNENVRQYDQGRDALIRQFQADQQRIQAAETAARAGAEDAYAQAGSDSLLRALAARPDAASVPVAPVQPFQVAPAPRPKVKPKPKPKAKR